MMKRRKTAKVERKGEGRKYIKERTKGKVEEGKDEEEEGRAVSKEGRRKINEEAKEIRGEEEEVDEGKVKRKMIK